MKKLSTIIIASLLITTMLAGCTSTTQPDETSKKTLIVAGSTSVSPLVKELKEAYEEQNENVRIDVQETGSSAGITATIEGAADIGMSSRDLKDSEEASGLVKYPIANDGIAVIVNNENPVSDLSMDQVQQIFSGEITNWSEVGGNDGKIIVVSREEGSGTRGAFEELVGLQEKYDKDGQTLTKSLTSSTALFENSTGAVKTNVATSKNAIGYISLGTLDDTVKATTIDGIVCSDEDILNGTYPIARPFLLVTLGEAAGDSLDFINFILSNDGQAIVKDHNYVTVN